MILARARSVTLAKHKRASWLSRSALLSAVLALAVSLTLATAPSAEAATKAKAKRATVAAASKVKADPNRPPASARPIYESIVIDAVSGQVLHQVNADTQAYPASLTKMMTLYMLFDALEKGKVRLDTPLKVSVKATTPGPSKLYVTPNSTLTVEQAIYAVVVLSANDVALVIAENLGGSEERFCNLMTVKARALGMTRTQFKNPHGLPNKGQISTARDMAILARRLMTDFPDKFAYFSKTEFPYNGVMIRGHNHFMEHYDGADGLKTGYTFASGFNLAASARRGDQRLITVVFGGASAKVRDEHVAQLMDAGFMVAQNTRSEIAVAQAVDPFPASPPQMAPTTAQLAQEATGPQSDVEPTSVAAGDTDDAIGRQIAAEEVAPPLAEMAALVPPPSVGKPKAVAAAAAATRKAANAIAPLAPPAPTNSWGIQVGAYMNRLQAETQANAAVLKVRADFSTASARVVPVKLAPTKILYRAQVIGLGQKDMAHACKLAAQKGVQSACKPVAPDQKTVASREGTLSR